jgi:hypothetical protein
MNWIICIAATMVIGVANAQTTDPRHFPPEVFPPSARHIPAEIPPPKAVRTIRIGSDGREKPPHPYWPRQVDPAVAR